MVVAPLPSLDPHLAVYLELALDHIDPYQRQIGLHAVTTTRIAGVQADRPYTATTRT